jgi:hypothetical protein
MSGRVSYYGGIVKDGLILDLDAGKLDSYNRTGIIWNDISGNNYNGTLTNDPIFYNDNSGYFQLDGIDDFITLGNVTNLGFTNGIFSVESWVYVPSTWTSGSQFPNLVSKGGSAGWDTDGWSLYLFRDYLGGFGYGLGIRNGSTLTSSSTYVLLQSSDLDKFINITACMDLTSIKMYQNGVLKKTVTQTTLPIGSLVPPASNGSNVIIGRGPTSNYFPGRVSNVKLYNKKLSDSEVLQNYNALKGRYI